ncbi:hypothetical protein KQI86_11170 [Clostridium sp. MSJ-11]|uniref:Uncharacterized protein n=1 Tax=Clostridium mobile TaxID=2841512 RepID=A0ABS6EJD5_9CLOT|nr:hypothetical protein [Clostridium mobile]MBU5484897.1 hypothetical protein [Clostridium mobile]
MDKNKIINLLLDGNISEVEEIEWEDKDLCLLRIYYDFDEDEIQAAKAYEKEEIDEQEEGDEDLFKSYLYDLALDTVSEIIEEIVDDLEIDCQFSSYEIEEESDCAEFAAAFYPKDKEVDLDLILDKIDE